MSDELSVCGEVGGFVSMNSSFDDKREILYEPTSATRGDLIPGTERFRSFD